jgi:hypothetical protein
LSVSAWSFKKGGSLENLLMGVGVMMMVMWTSMCRLWSFATSLTRGWSVPTVHTVAVFPIVFPQPAPSLSAVGVVVGIRLSGWTTA